MVDVADASHTCCSCTVHVRDIERAARVSSAAVSSPVSVSTRKLACRSESFGVVAPPLFHPSRAIGENDHLARATACFANVFFVRQANLDPQLDGAGRISADEIRFAFRGQAAAELECFVGMQREGEEPHHQPLLGLRGMARQRQRVPSVDLAVQVRHREIGPVDGGAQRH